MDNGQGLVLWCLGGAGITLVYAAYKHVSPLAVLQNHITSTATKPASTTGGVVSKSDAMPPVAPVPATASYAGNGTPYSVGVDGTGTQYVYNGDGSPIGVLPSEYGHAPGNYIPSEY